jgi:hypothetical protein|tara:strand:- start:143 stop:631 length:489 start_codon:yes stop_codon:yes gene_type:complete
MAGKLGMGLLETLLENLDRDLNLADTTLTNPTITTNALATFSGGVRASRFVEDVTLENVDAQNLTVTAARFLKGLIVHTSVTGGGTATLDTGPNLIAGLGLTVVGQAMKCTYVNDGDQTVTFAVATGTTLTNVANTVLTNASCTLICRMTAAATVDVTIANN